jgi:hypothetical protein
MTPPPRPPFWSRSRILAIALASGVAVFVGANVHLVMVSFSSQPDCVLPSATEGAASYRAAKPSC